MFNETTERVEYLSQFKRVVLKDPPTFFELNDVKAVKVPVNPKSKEGGKDGTIELPLIPVIEGQGPNGAGDESHHPLLTYVVPQGLLESSDSLASLPSTQDVDIRSEAFSELLGPGPYHLLQTLHLPHCDRLHFGFANPPEGGRANIEIRHALKVVLRVERCDDKYLDKNGKRKRWDIVVQIGVGIVSV